MTVTRVQQWNQPSLFGLEAFPEPVKLSPRGVGYYQPATGIDLAGAQALGGVPNPPGAWYVGACGYPPVPGLTRFRIFGTPPGPQLLADEAVKALRLPAPVIRVNPAPPVLTRFGIWVTTWPTAISWTQLATRTPASSWR